MVGWSLRIGIGGMHLADPEDFAYSDLNRQRGSSQDTIGKKKVEVVSSQLKAINPALEEDVTLRKEVMHIAGFSFFAFSARDLQRRYDRVGCWNASVEKQRPPETKSRRRRELP